MSSGTRLMLAALLATLLALAGPALALDDWDQAQQAYRQGDLAGAASLLARALGDKNLAPERRVQAHSLRGTALMRLGQADQALKEFEAALALDPEFTEGYFKRSLAREKLGRLGPAQADMERFLKMRPGDEEAQTRLAQLKEARERAGEPLSLEQLESRLDPALAARDFGQGLALTTRFLAAPSLSTSERARGLVLRGACQRGLRQHQEAMASFEQALKLEPRESEALYQRALTRIEMGDEPGGRRDLEDLLTFEPGHQAAATTLAQLPKPAPPPTQAQGQIPQPPQALGSLGQLFLGGSLARKVVGFAVTTLLAALLLWLAAKLVGAYRASYGQALIAVLAVGLVSMLIAYVWAQFLVGPSLGANWLTGGVGVAVQMVLAFAIIKQVYSLSLGQALALWFCCVVGLPLAGVVVGSLLIGLIQ